MSKLTWDKTTRQQTLEVIAGQLRRYEAFVRPGFVGFPMISLTVNAVNGPERKHFPAFPEAWVARAHGSAASGLEAHELTWLVSNGSPPQAFLDRMEMLGAAYLARVDNMPYIREALDEAGVKYQELEVDIAKDINDRQIVLSCTQRGATLIWSCRSGVVLDSDVGWGDEPLAISAGPTSRDEHKVVWRKMHVDDFITLALYQFGE